MRNTFRRFVIFLCYLPPASSIGMFRRYDEINGMWGEWMMNRSGTSCLESQQFQPR